MVEDFEALKIENKRIVEQTAGKTKVKVIERATAATMTVFPENEDRGTQFTEQYQENECQTFLESTEQLHQTDLLARDILEMEQTNEDLKIRIAELQETDH